ncbi:guanine deaminase [Azospirillum sp. TSO22-1]|uniref:guanine deaminase n=1 Tax=Azospirillum sp. TSO22-1 TaxID=716789 RepID=UPI000D609C36|nr:guanine deaminase [Azospirillum sp. TSO22-1]PWC31854.1 guanine deaminase [Azospirillum sp. TSO22-1]
MTDTRAIRGRLLTFTAEPAGPGDSGAYRYLSDGLLRIEDGRIAAIGPAADLLPSLPPGTPVEHHPDALVIPGFIDPHIHFPQTQVIASYGAQLLDWLEKYTFVEEQKYADPAHAAANARFFLDELLRNGTTTAAVYCTVHPQSADAFFAESERRGTAMIAGKVMMDHGAPDALRDTARSGYDDSKALIARWHGRGRQRYAVTPRFAVTSTEEQLAAAGALLREHPDCYLQTHLSENRAEIAAVRARFPWGNHYTDVYDRHGLLGPRSLFGHCIHLEDDEVRRLAETGSVAVFCPTSNLFMGSGLFDRARLTGHVPPVRTALATDIGGGTSYSMLRTAAEAYKVLQLQGQNLPALTAFHAMTRGNAEALGLRGEVGSLEPGCWADVVVLDSHATPAMAHRMETVRDDLEEELFVLMTLGDDRAVKATYVQGKCAFP